MAAKPQPAVTKKQTEKNAEKYGGSMARHKKGDGELGPAFWFLFVVGMIVVLSLFRGFVAAVQNSRKGRSEKRGRTKKTLATQHQD